MKTIILAGGLGTRLSEYTNSIPKPMVEVGGKPMLWHIMNLYAKYNYKDFSVALGYKGEIIKEYFSNKHKDWNVDLIDTGKNTMTGGRVKRIQKYIGKETCMLTYGDGIADVNINSLLAFHKSHKKLITVTAVRTPARFGAIKMKDNKVISFKEKSKLDEGWINGGFFVIEPDFFDFIDGDSTYLERDPLEKLAQDGQLMAYKHQGFWQPMDTLRELRLLRSMWDTNQAPWKTW